MSHIITNQKQINNRLNVLQSKLISQQSKLNRDFVIAESYSDIINSLSHISYILNNLLTAVTFSKLNILHSNIIKSNELLNELQEINTKIPNKLLIPPSVNDLETFEQTIKISAYHTNTRIVFLLQVPITNPKEYTLHHSYALPVKQTSDTHLIIPTAKYLLIRENSYMFTNEQCLKTKSQLYLCFNQNFEFTYDDPCEIELLQYKKPYKNCHIRAVEMKFQIKEIENNAWLYYEPKEETGKLQCPEVTRQIEFHGTYLVDLPENCTLQIHGESLIYDTSKFEEIIESIPGIEMPKIDISDQERKLPVNVTLEDIQLDDITQLKLQLREPLNPEEMLPILSHRISSWTILLYIILLIILMLIGCKFLFLRFRPKKILHVKPVPAPLDEIELH